MNIDVNLLAQTYGIHDNNYLAFRNFSCANAKLFDAAMDNGIVCVPVKYANKLVTAFRAATSELYRDYEEEADSFLETKDYGSQNWVVRSAIIEFLASKDGV